MWARNVSAPRERIRSSSYRYRGFEFKCSTPKGEEEKAYCTGQFFGTCKSQVWASNLAHFDARPNIQLAVFLVPLFSGLQFSIKLLVLLFVLPNPPFAIASVA